MPLYDPTRHVSLPARPWDPAAVRAWLRRFAADALRTWTPQGWPLHPHDAIEGERLPPLRTLYFGEAGVWIALGRLAAAGDCALPTTLAETYARILEAYRAAPDTGTATASWLLGESGVRTLAALTRPTPANADALAALIEGNRENPTNEALWGAPATMNAAWWLHRATREARWAALWRASADVLWSRWTFDEGAGTWLWEQVMDGQRLAYLGAGHGWAGNVDALWRGAALLSEGRRAALLERTIDGVARLLEVEGDRANLPPLAGRRGLHLVQWCHGGPGLILALRHAPLPEVTPALLKVAATIVDAGPLTKGVALCHGSAGSGAALLELHRRSGDRRWLGHARELAMAALTQAEAAFAEHGRWHMSLWTGDAGLAWLLMDCLEGVSRGLPGLDALDWRCERGTVAPLDATTWPS
ncbi:MAG: LanC-like protein [Myxococcales bacterium]|nr:LanC-like protein [Myxococcales bacterium]